MFALYRHKYWV